MSIHLLTICWIVILEVLTIDCGVKLFRYTRMKYYKAKQAKSNADWEETKQQLLNWVDSERLKRLREAHKVWKPVADQKVAALIAEAGIPAGVTSLYPDELVTFQWMCWLAGSKNLNLLIYDERLRINKVYLGEIVELIDNPTAEQLREAYVWLMDSDTCGYGGQE